MSGIPPPGWPPIEDAPSPPSVPGVPQPIIEAGPPAVFPDFVPLLPPPLIGEPTPPFPPPSIPPPPGPLVGPAIASGGGVVTPPPSGGTFPYTFPDFSTTVPYPPVLVTGVQPPVSQPTTPQIPPYVPPVIPPPVWTTPPVEPGESESDYMDRCIAAVQGQGATLQQATEACEEAYLEGPP